ncbi:MAG: tyrosine-type recombinase/integrase [Pelagibaca sp.]
MTTELADSPVNEWRTKALIREFVRRAVATMMARQEAPFDEAESAAYISGLERQTARVTTAQRNRDWSVAAELGATTAPLVGVQPESLLHPVVAREFLAQTRALLALSLQVERDCDNPLSVGRSLLEEVGLKPERRSLKPPMQLSTAIETACEEAPPDVETKIRAVGCLALAFFEDVPVATLSRDRVFDFLKFVWNMPKNWGQLHGKNRHETVGSGLGPIQIKLAADAEDKALLDEVLSDASLTVPEKRFRLVQKLRPRLTDGYLFVQRDMFNRIVRAALGAGATGRDLDDDERVVPSHTQLRRRFHMWHKAAKTECGLPTRVSRPKRRRSWSIEHLVKLFTSPLYAGTSSMAQRWRKATATRLQIIRDALYWVPLFMVTLGVRPEEILQLKIKNVRRRDGALCLFLGEDLDERLKNDQSRRVLPVPQLLIDLGFREWIVAMRRAGNTWAFPDVEPSATDSRRSQLFGNRMRTYLGHLNLKFKDEDIYAMRRTLSSKLLALRVDPGVRQRILGHLEGSTVDRHYSDDGLPELKALLDQVDYGVKVGRMNRIAFPVITGCSAPILPSVDVMISLSDDEEICAIRLSDPDTDETMLAMRVEGSPSPKDEDAKNFPVFSARHIATELLARQSNHSLTLPACEASTAALEHLLILGDLPERHAIAAMPLLLATGDHTYMETSLEHQLEPSVPSLADQTEGTARTASGLEPGDTAICVFPLTRHSHKDGQPRPGLIVGSRTLKGRRYLDIARSAPAEPGDFAPHHLVVADQAGLACARIKMPTIFDLRRRILVAEDDTHRLHRRLGTLNAISRKRLPETLAFAGDISPDPVCEQSACPTGGFKIERKSSKVLQPPLGKSIR